jgi:hypothetical protein
MGGKKKKTLIIQSSPLCGPRVLPSMNIYLVIIIILANFLKPIHQEE